LKAVALDGILKQVWAIPTQMEAVWTRMVFALARGKAERLGPEMLDAYHRKYPPMPRDGGGNRAPEMAVRAGNLARFVSGFADIGTILETGAGDATLAVALAKMGKTVTAIDLNPKPNAEVGELGIPFVKMDVMQLAFEDNRFDCAISFEAFEHFMEPDKALSEMLRVVKPGGCVYLDFGPLYYCSHGLHIYCCLGIPYSQYLFDYAMMERYIEENRLPRIVPKTLNRWHVEDYDRLWKRFANRAEIVRYEKIRNYDYLRMIRRHPRLFKTQTSRFEDLVVHGIRIVLAKK
jgi:ubiquinone/menaquinone biosynthesis C-methylase UbiE